MRIKSGLIGRAIQASRSPRMHQEEARAQGVELSYELFDFTENGWPDEALGELLARLGAEGYAGVNVTYPFKQAAAPFLDELAQSARQVGAVNTVAMRGDRLVGHNTDMAGFRDSLRDALGPEPVGRVLQLGAGGAGAAVASALLSMGAAHLRLADVDPARAERLAADLAQRFGADRVAAAAATALATDDMDGLVNATPVGMAADPGPPIAPDLIAPRHWVADVVYFPLQTELLRLAREKGCRVIDGAGMAVAQAALAFEIITGLKADPERMRRVFFAASKV